MADAHRAPSARSSPPPSGPHWLKLHVNVHDDEGAPVRIDLDAAKRLGRAGRSPQHVLIYFAVTHPRWIWLIVSSAAFMVLFGLPALFVARAFRWGSPLVQWPIVIACLPLPLLILWGAVEPLFRISRARRHALSAFRAAKVCASCHYRLDGIPADAVGLTRCPECGLAWRLTPPDSPVADAAPSPTTPPL